MDGMFAAILDRTAKVAILILSLSASALADDGQLEEAASEEAADTEDQNWKNSWRVGTRGTSKIAGVPKVCLQEHWFLGGQPIVAIWDNGTIAWLDVSLRDNSRSDTRRRGTHQYFVSTIPVEELDEALEDIKKFTARMYPERSQAAGTRSCPMEDEGVGLQLLDPELFITHLWSTEALQSIEHVKKLLSAPTQDELVEYLHAKMARSWFDNPWHFLAERYAEHTDMKSEAILDLTVDDPRSREVFKAIAERLVKDGEHFALCEKRIRSLIPNREPGTTMISKPLDFRPRFLEGRFEKVDGKDSYLFFYRKEPENGMRDNPMY